MMVSKAVLYEPVKELCDKFPAWMLANASVTAPEDLERYNVLLAASLSVVCSIIECCWQHHLVAHADYVSPL